MGNFNVAEMKRLMEEMRLGSLPSSHLSDAILYGAMTSKIAPSAFATSVAASVQRRPHNPQSMLRQIASRMGWLDEPASHLANPFREIHCARLDDEQAVVFLIHNDKALTIYDDLNLFPSDALVSSLRLLLA